MQKENFHTLTDGQLLAIAGTKNLITLELAHSDDVFAALGTLKPPYWPPELNDDDSFSHFLKALTENPKARIWGAYYLVCLEPARHLVGMGGYIAPPDTTGMVEIGYSMLTPYRRRGHASGLCRMLIDQAFRDPRVTLMTARTYPHLIASVGVLTKLGFTLAGKDDEGIVTYHLPR